MRDNSVKRLMVLIIIAQSIALFSALANLTHCFNRPTIETRTTVYVVPWPWALEWDGKGFIMRLEIRK